MFKDINKLALLSAPIHWIFGLARAEHKFMASDRFFFDQVNETYAKFTENWSIQVNGCQYVKRSNVVYFMCFRLYSEDNQIEASLNVLGAYLLFNAQDKNVSYISLVPRLVWFLEDKSTTTAATFH